MFSKLRQWSVGAAIPLAALVVAAPVHAVTLIPTGSLTATLGNISDTASDAFAIVVPVVLAVAGLMIAVKLVKRFISKAG